ncbi:MAG: citB [Verrucomicrobiales bacterium]|nr:citB [Verrucomicrobiales bacterium]MDB6129047.1 citB [Verrucomicrobiales bacterium]
MAKKIRVLIADDHPIVRRGVAEALGEQRDMVIEAEAGEAGEVLTLLKKNRVDVVILDITLPGRSGLDVLAELKKKNPKMPVLMLSMHPEDQFGLRVLRAGASGYMTKESVPEELVKAIRLLAKGERYISPTLAEKLARPSELSNGSLHESLSGREFQVLQEIARGQMIKEIAAEFQLSVKTVSTYRARILTKMRMNSNAELTIYALKNHLLTAAPFAN